MPLRYPMRILKDSNDRQLAKRLSVQRSQICKVRKRRVPVASSLLISMHEETGLSLRQLRALMGDYRAHTRPSAKQPAMPQLQYLKGLEVPLIGNLAHEVGYASRRGRPHIKLKLGNCLTLPVFFRQPVPYIAFAKWLAAASSAAMLLGPGASQSVQCRLL